MTAQRKFEIHLVSFNKDILTAKRKFLHLVLFDQDILTAKRKFQIHLVLFDIYKVEILHNHNWQHSLLMYSIRASDGHLEILHQYHKTPNWFEWLLGQGWIKLNSSKINRWNTSQPLKLYSLLLDLTARFLFGNFVLIS